jgi:hypothetical protein
MAAFGLWMRLLLDMAIDDESGEVSGTAERLARSYGCSSSEFIDWLNELAESGTADVFRIGSDSLPVFWYGQSEWPLDGQTDRVIIQNRRMRKALNKSKKRSEWGKKGAAKRWQNHRQPVGNKNGQALASSISTSTSISTPEEQETRKGEGPLFGGTGARARGSKSQVQGTHTSDAMRLFGGNSQGKGPDPDWTVPAGEGLDL